MIYAPTLDDMADSRAKLAELNNQNGDLNISPCKSELRIRVMKKKCDFGASKDYCVLDLKD